MSSYSNGASRKPSGARTRPPGHDNTPVGSFVAIVGTPTIACVSTCVHVANSHLSYPKTTKRDLSLVMRTNPDALHTRQSANAKHMNMMEMRAVLGPSGFRDCGLMKFMVLFEDSKNQLADPEDLLRISDELEGACAGTQIKSPNAQPKDLYDVSKRLQLPIFFTLTREMQMRMLEGTQKVDRIVEYIKTFENGIDGVVIHGAAGSGHAVPKCFNPRLLHRLQEHIVSERPDFCIGITKGITPENLRDLAELRDELPTLSLQVSTAVRRSKTGGEDMKLSPEHLAAFVSGTQQLFAGRRRAAPTDRQRVLVNA